ncbi:MAG: hypothetical protein E6Q83_05785 [Thiothrix sp.]|nr:MAG: hypothetical protein E6Q83_05785 [Thiothrix sp.]
MDIYPDKQDKVQTSSYLETARRLLDGLILYRLELGEAGRHLELLLRYSGVSASTDLPCSKRMH